MDRVALVTGGAGGIGGAIVAALRDEGFGVAVLDRSADFSCDLADSDQIRATAAAVLERFGRCDVLVHAAAAFDRASLRGLSLETWRRVQAVNVESAVLLCQAFAPGMAERGFGRIVFVTSNTVERPPGADLLPYVASKAALEGVVRVLALDLGPSGVTVNAVAPGLTRTTAAEAAMPAEAFEDVRARQAIPRTLEPQDIAGGVAFLVSERADAITGQTICVDAGLVFR